jgi:ABC-2 type transport system ATP-binding protein
MTLPAPSERARLAEPAEDLLEMIRTRGLRRVFKTKRGSINAVHGVDLVVRSGEIYGVLGPNGAGKTTTLRMLATLLPASGGEATVAGCDLRLQPEEVRRRIGWVGQTGGTDPRLSAREELIFQARVYGDSPRRAAERAARLLVMVELGDVADRPSASYSGGQKRRLDLALGLVHRLRLLFLDEPTTGLDPQSRAHLWQEVRKVREAGMTVFLTTHYLEEADALCDRAAIIDHGRIVAEGTLADLKRQIGSDVISLRLALPADRVDAALGLFRSQSFVRQIESEDAQLWLYVDDGERAVPVVLRLLDAAGIALETIAMSRPSLDDVFLRQTGHSLRDGAA